jgi:hypothetical protein
MTREPTITIDGRQLTERCAVSSFLGQMREPDALGTDAVGRAIAAGYAARLAEVEALLVPPEAP